MWYLEQMKSLLTPADEARLKAIYAPVVVGVPMEDARRDICVMPDGELRSYGWIGKTGPTDYSQAKLYYRASRNAGLDWTLHEAPSRDVMASAARTKTGRYVTTVTRRGEGTFARLSEIGPDDPAPREVKICDELFHDAFLPKQMASGRLIVTGHFIYDGNYHPSVLLSDDDGESWKVVQLNPTPKHTAVWPHLGIRWQNNGAEPNVCQLPDGRLMLIARTSLDYLYVYYSEDDGDSWTAGELSDFHCTLTTPFFLNLSDGRILFFWNNTRPLAEHCHETDYPPVGNGVKVGAGEDVFTNRDANHAAITSDGVTWTGFRELGLDEVRGASDFRVKGGRNSSNDKSVHQFQAWELPYNKVLVSYGQHEIARKMVIFDLDWLYEKERHEDFQLGLKNMTTHMYVVSLNDCFVGKGFAGHCAWNRTDGALLMPDPDLTGGEALQICRVHDERLVSELQGAVWNFPGSEKGELKLQIRVAGSGIRVRLCDHWMNACDEHASLYASCEFELDARTLPRDEWQEVTIRFDTRCGAEVYAGERLLFTAPMKLSAPHGLSYLHMQTMAESTDFKGTYIRKLDFKGE